MEEWESGERTTRAGQVMQKRVFAVSDKTASLLLTVWGKIPLTLGKWYLVANASIRMYSGKVLLTTTPETVFTSSIDAGEAFPVDEDVIDIVKGEVASGNVVSEHLCLRGHSLAQMNPDALMTWCQFCDCFVKNTKLRRQYKGTLTLMVGQGEQRTFYLNNSVLQSSLHLVDVDTPEQLTAQLLAHDMAEVFLADNVVKEIIFGLPDDKEPATSDSATCMRANVCVKVEDSS